MVFPVGTRASQARYVIGVDLGTTNTAVAFVDTRSVDQRVDVFEVPQLVAPGAVDRRAQLPSFVYLAGEHDLGPADTALPWDPGTRVVVGELARSEGARQPERMIASSKSWLCHAGVDRHAAILPWGVEQGPKRSPVEASSAVLAHVARAWDHVHAGSPDARFADQDVIVTVPASFDEAARELTIEAAHKAGLGALVLVEEPQAAFYAWINTHPERASLRPGERVLVFDVGGGTTDFTIIQVGQDAALERTAVGDHLLLGGDNVDLTLAKIVEARLVQRGGGRKLDALQWHGLVHACRLAKESLLSNPSVESLPITVSGRGAKLIGGTLRDDLARSELDRVLLDGFFPSVERGAAARRVRGGLQEFGLPYAADPAVTRHLATFLVRHDVDRIDAVLFNGGTMAPQVLRQRVIAQLAHWQPTAGAPRELSAHRPELAVAQGAAWFGLVRRGLGTRIGGGTARAYYVGVGPLDGDGRDRAVCLAGKGLEEGATVELQRDFQLVTNRPVSLKLYSSSTRDDAPGAVVLVGDGRPETTDDGSDLLELPPIVTVLRNPGRGDVNVHLQVRVTELGALEIWCAEPGAASATGGSPSGWRLSFDMRAGGAKVAAEAGTAPAELDPRVPGAQALLKEIFTGPVDRLPRVMKLLEESLGSARDAWPTATARALFDAAFEVEEARKRSADHEARWLNLTAFCLRPGLGAPLDDWRAKQMWRIFHDDLVHPNAEQARLGWWIAWRRIAGGLNKGQQHQIYLRLAPLFVPGSRSKKKWYEMKPSPQEAAEMLRCLANLERLSPEAKIVLGDELVRRFETKKGREDPLHLWALGRIGGRVPLYGPLDAVVMASKVGVWLDAVLGWDWPDSAKAAFPVAQLARRTGDRGRDLDEDRRARAAGWLRAAGNERAAVLVEQIVALEAREEHIALGDTLPAGLRLLSPVSTEG